MALDVADRPVEQVLRVVLLPLARELPVALEVLGVAPEVALADRGGERGELDVRVAEPDVRGRRPAAGRGGPAIRHSATTS